MPATKVHHTPTTDKSWDGGANKKAYPNDAAVLKLMYAWYDADGDPDVKGTYKFPHHMASGHAANVKACTSGIGVLNGGMGGTKIPDSDREGVYKHLAAHLKDAGVDDVPELKSAPSQLAQYRDAQRNVRETRRIPFSQFELREAPGGSGLLTYTGYACITETPYEMEDWLGPYSEVVRNGAFTKTLGEDADVAFLINHEGMTLARTKSSTMQLSEDDQGLLVVASLDPANLHVQALRSAIERGDMDEMSFAFWVMRQQWSPDYEQRDILEVKLHQGDVSCVNFGANPATGGTVSIRSADALRALRRTNTRAFVAALKELRQGMTLSASTMDVLQQVLSLSSDADDCVDQVQIILSDLMDVPNPDDDDQWDGLDTTGAGDGEGDPVPVGQGQTNALSLARARLALLAS